MSAQTVLFDAPGPKARRRYAIATVLGILLVALVFAGVLWWFGQAGQLKASLWTSLFEPVIWTSYLIPGLIKTVQAAGLSIILPSPPGSSSAWDGSPTSRPCDGSVASSSSSSGLCPSCS